MHLSEPTIIALGPIITGDNKLAPYRSGPELVSFFNQFGVNDEYGQGFPSRWRYAEEKLRHFNGREEIEKILLSSVDRRHYLSSGQSCEVVVDHLNQFLEFDGYKIIPLGKKYRLTRHSESDIVVNNPYKNSQKVTHVFIVEQLEKCDRKLAEGDFDGAITNARSLVEAVLKDIENKYDVEAPDYDGNLLKLFRRVQTQLNLNPGDKGLQDSIRQILSGLNNIVTGLASIRNSMSDSHVRSYRPAEHHARLAVNSAKTLCHFLFDTQIHQSKLKQK